MLRERDQQIALARDEGVTVTELAERFEISHQRVSAIGKSVTALVNLDADGDVDGGLFDRLDQLFGG